MGGTAAADISTDDDLEIEIRAGEEWCFVYGEQDWVSPAFNVPDPNNAGEQVGARFGDYRTRAANNNANKIPCS
ncbi:hypothetical protein GCM10011297_35130 [Bacterioplanes sanyensis]|nr:hypothetical protein GCM10011297_35130 [Bacterioplanes sanyensis]